MEWRGKGLVKGKGKVRDERLENGIGHLHACHVFSRVARYEKGAAGEGEGLSDTGSLSTTAYCAWGIVYKACT